MEILTLINECSGAVQRTGVDEISSVIGKNFETASNSVEFFSGDAGELIKFARKRLQDSQPDLVVSAGGDGTIALIADLIQGTSVPLFPLPAGTMNCLSLDLGYATDIEKACRQAVDGQPVPADVAFVDGQIFMNSVVFGTFAELAEVREEFRDPHGFTESLAATAEAAHRLATTSPITFTIDLEGERDQLSTNALMVSNNLFAGVRGLAPHREKLNAGQLGVYEFNCHGGIDFLGIITQTLLGNLNSMDGVKIKQCRSCTVDADVDEVEFTVDGEIRHSSTPLEFTIKPSAIRLLSPSP